MAGIQVSAGWWAAIAAADTGSGCETWPMCAGGLSAGVGRERMDTFGGWIDCRHRPRSREPASSKRARMRASPGACRWRRWMCIMSASSGRWRSARTPCTGSGSTRCSIKGRAECIRNLVGSATSPGVLPFLARLPYRRLLMLYQRTFTPEGQKQNDWLQVRGPRWDHPGGWVQQPDQRPRQPAVYQQTVKGTEQRAGVESSLRVPPHGFRHRNRGTGCR